DPEGPFDRRVRARDRVRYVGEPIAVVLAETVGQALDAAELLMIDADPLEVLVDPEQAAADEVLLFPECGTNIATRFDHRWGDDVLAGAEVVVRGRFENQRVAPVPMEMNGIVVAPEDDDAGTGWVSSRVPLDVANCVVECLGEPRERIRVISPDVGGGFGAKVPTYPEYLVVAK